VASGRGMGIRGPRLAGPKTDALRPKRIETDRAHESHQCASRGAEPAPLVVDHMEVPEDPEAAEAQRVEAAGRHLTADGVL
jgi:hypothetical protein